MLWRWPETFLSVLLVSLEGSYWGKSASPLVQAAQWTTQRKLDIRCVKLSADRVKLADLYVQGKDSGPLVSWL